MSKRRYSVTISDQDLAKYTSEVQLKAFIAQSLANLLVERMTVEVEVSIDGGEDA